jgi:hypothetical protein
MKICPGCDREYEDDTLNFCLMCGTPLADGSVQPTVAMRAEETVTRQAAMPTAPYGRPADTTEPVRKSRLPWILAGLAVAGVAGLLVMLGVAALLQSSRGSVTNGPRIEAPVKPAKKAGNAVSPVASPKSEAPIVSNDDDTPAASVVDDLSEPTPIVWSTAAMTFTVEPGTVLTFECPPDGEEAPVWGSDVYSTGSSICTAAVHAGKITLLDGGVVTIEYRPGRPLYGSTTRNGITTNTYGEFPGSFVVRGLDDSPAPGRKAN